MSVMSILGWLVEHSVVLVGTVFLVLVASIFWPGRRDSLQRHAMIPFDDDK